MSVFIVGVDLGTANTKAAVREPGPHAPEPVVYRMKLRPGVPNISFFRRAMIGLVRLPRSSFSRTRSCLPTERLELLWKRFG